MEKNPGRKAVAKLMLKRYEKIILIQLMKRYKGILFSQFFIFSFWGKFWEGENKPSTKIIQRPLDLYRLINDDTIEIKDVRIFSEDVMEVSVIKKSVRMNMAVKLIFLLPVSRPHGHVSSCMNLWKHWVNKCCIMIPTV